LQRKERTRGEMSDERRDERRGERRGERKEMAKAMQQPRIPSLLSSLRDILSAEATGSCTALGGARMPSIACR
jgi:hypothetical protein